MRAGTRGWMWAAVLMLGALVGLEAVAQAGSGTGSQTGQPRGRPTLAIIGIEATEAVQAKADAEGHGNDLDRIVQAFDGQLIAALTQTNRFQVTARSDLERLLVDNDLQQVFASDPVRALSILGTQYGMVFKVDDYRDEYVEQKARVEGRGDRVIRARRTIYISVVATIYDIERATTLASVTTEFRATPLDKRWEGLGVDREVLEGQMAGALDGIAQTLAQDVTYDVLERTFPARIVQVQAGQAIISWGEGTPIEVGQTWRVFDVQQVEDVDFPGEFIEIEQPVGLIRIETVGGRTSSATVIEDLGMGRRAICRLVRDDADSADQGGLMRRRLRCLATLAAAVALVPLLAGCGGGLKDGQERFLAGDFRGAESALASAAKKNRSGADAVIVWLEYASVLHHLGQYTASTDAFATAEAQIESIDNAPAVSVGNQTRLLLTNPEEATYRASGVDRVMAPTLRGLANILAGRTERARQSFVAAQFAREIAQDKRAEEIARAREASQAAASERQSQAQQTIENEETQQRLEQLYARLEQFSAYADYAVPFSDWLEAVYLLGVQQDGADADRAVTLLNRVRGMVEGHAHLEADAESAGAAARGRRLTGVTYIVFASGLAPLRREQRIDLPLFIVTDSVDYVGVALPVLSFNDAAEPSLVIEAGGATAETSVLTDMDRVVASEFNAVKGELIRQSITGAVVKAAAAYGLNRSVAGQDPLIEAAVRLLTISYQVVMNKTDTRSWVSLPKFFATARVETPPSGEIVLRRPKGESQVIRVDPDAVNIVYARSLGPGRPMSVDWAPLYPPGAGPSGGTQPAAVGGQQDAGSEGPGGSGPIDEGLDRSN